MLIFRVYEEFPQVFTVAKSVNLKKSRSTIVVCTIFYDFWSLIWELYVMMDWKVSSFTLKLFLTLIPTRKMTYTLFYIDALLLAMWCIWWLRLELENLMLSPACMYVRWLGYYMTMGITCLQQQRNQPKTPLVNFYNPALHHCTQADALCDVLRGSAAASSLPSEIYCSRNVKKHAWPLSFPAGYIPSQWRPVLRALKPRTNPSKSTCSVTFSRPYLY